MSYRYKFKKWLEDLKVSLVSRNRHVENSATIPELSLIFAGLALYLFDVGTDINLIYAYYYTPGPGHKTACLLTFLFVLIPALIGTFTSYQLYVGDDGKGLERESFCTKWLRYICMFLQLTVVLRYLESFKYGVKSMWVSGREAKEFKAMMIYESRSTALIGFLEAFLEAAPQAILQIYMVILSHGDLAENIYGLQSSKYFSIATSLISLAKAVITFKRAYSIRGDLKLPVAYLESFMHFLWQLLTISARIFAMAAVATAYPYLFLLVCLVHWLGVQRWLFEIDVRQFDLLSWVLTPAFSFVFLFTFHYNRTSSTGSKFQPTAHKCLVFYVVIFMENTIFLFSWFYSFDIEKTSADTYWLRMVIISTNYGLFLSGIVAFLVNSQCFYPANSSLDEDNEPALNEDFQPEREFREALQDAGVYLDHLQGENGNVSGFLQNVLLYSRNPIRKVVKIKLFFQPVFHSWTESQQDLLRLAGACIPGMHANEVNEEEDGPLIGSLLAFASQQNLTQWVDNIELHFQNEMVKFFHHCLHDFPLSNKIRECFRRDRQSFTEVIQYIKQNLIKLELEINSFIIQQTTFENNLPFYLRGEVFPNLRCLKIVFNCENYGGDNIPFFDPRELSKLPLLEEFYFKIVGNIEARWMKAKIDFPRNFENEVNVVVDNLGSLTLFHFHANFTSEALEHLALMMPNVQALRLVFDEDNFQVLGRTWGNITDVRLLPQSDVSLATRIQIQRMRFIAFGSNVNIADEPA